MEKEKLPKGWVEVQIKDVFKINPGHKDIEIDDDDDVSFIPMPSILAEANKIENIVKKKYREVKKGYTKFVEDDVLFAKITPCMENGKIAVAKNLINSIGCGTTEVHVFRSIGLFSNKLLFYFLVQPGFREFCKNNFSGAVGQQRISKDKIGDYVLPLPPLPEQNRIVAKLDRLFGHLEALKARLGKIPPLLKDFRQAVLTQAVTGKLTEEWREGKSLEEWRKLVLNELILEKPRNGYSPKAVEYVTSIKSMSLSATTSGKFDPAKVKYLDIEKPEPESHLWLKNGDILIQRSNSLDYVGTSAIYDQEDNEFIYPDTMMKVRVNEKVINTFLNYVLSSSPTKQYFRKNASGTAGNMPKINQSTVMNTTVQLPSIKEQKEIVQRVENLFSKADLIEAKYQALKGQIEQLPQAILAKAFRGELVAQLPSDGDARELLEEIKKLKAEAEARKKSAKKVSKKPQKKNASK